MCVLRVMRLAAFCVGAMIACPASFAAGDAAETCLTTDNFHHTKTAIAACTEALQGPVVGANVRAKILLAQGEAFYWAGQQGLAIHALDEALKLDPKFEDAQVLRAWAEDDSGLRAKAIADVQEVLSNNPENARALYALGSFLLDPNDPEDAISAFKMALVIDPDYHIARSELARVYSDYADEGEKALSQYERLSAAGPEKLAAVRFGNSLGNAFDFYALTRYNLGLQRNKLLRFMDALEDFDWLVANYPEDWRAYEQRGWARFYLGDYSGARADADAVIQRDARCECGWLLRLEVLVRLKQNAEAMAAAQSLLLGPTTEEGRGVALFYRGYLHKLARNFGQAKADLETASSLNPDIHRALFTQLIQSGYYKGGMDDPYSANASTALDDCLADAACMR